MPGTCQYTFQYTSGPMSTIYNKLSTAMYIATISTHKVPANNKA